MKRSLTLVLVLTAASACLAAQTAATTAPPATPHTHSSIDAEPHPIISSDARWTRSVAVGIAALFAAAIPLGFMVRSTASQLEAPDPAHDATTTPPSH
jgi:hypothetical protein